MAPQHRLVASILVSILLHAVAYFLGTTSIDLPRQQAPITNGDKIRAVFARPDRSLPTKITARKQSPILNTGESIDSARGDAWRSTIATTPPETSRLHLPQTSEAFLPQEYLTRQPRPQSELSLEDITQPEQPGTFQMHLWINRRGETVYIETGEATAPTRFVEQIAARFETTRFAPGERHGVAVASIIRIEISY